MGGHVECDGGGFALKNLVMADRRWLLDEGYALAEQIAGQ